MKCALFPAFRSSAVHSGLAGLFRARRSASHHPPLSQDIKTCIARCHFPFFFIFFFTFFNRSSRFFSCCKNLWPFFLLSSCSAVKLASVEHSRSPGLDLCMKTFCSWGPFSSKSLDCIVYFRHFLTYPFVYGSSRWYRRTSLTRRPVLFHRRCSSALRWISISIMLERLFLRFCRFEFFRPRSFFVSHCFINCSAVSRLRDSMSSLMKNFNLR